MRQHRFLAGLAVIALAAAVTATPSGSYHPYGAISGAPLGEPPIPVVEFPITEEYAKAFVLKYEGAAVVGRMINRYVPPIGKRPSNVYWGVYQNLDSQNWGGYISDTSGAFVHRVNGTTGYFNVVQVSGPQVGAWTGVGGFNGQNLAQNGVDQRAMQTWYELYPNPAVYLFGVNNGDLIFSKVQWDPNTNLWFLQVADLTTGTWWSSEFSFNPELTTGEWITEVVGGAVPSMAGTLFSPVRWYDENLNPHTINDGDQVSWRVRLVSPFGGCVVPTYPPQGDDTFTNNAPGC